MRGVLSMAMIAAGFCVTACAPVTIPRHEAGTVTDSRYVTFFVLQGHSSGNPAVDRQLKADIVSALTDKRFVEASPEEAETVVVVQTATPAMHSRDALYEGWGGWNWRIADPRAPIRNEDYKVGTLVVDMFDAWTKQLVWHGAVPGEVSNRPGADTSVPRHAAARIFKDLPLAGYEAGSAPFDDSMPPSTRRMRVIFSETPAVLVPIAGEPRYEPVSGTALQRVINTPALIVREEAGMYYLRLRDTWMEAFDILGPWSAAGTVPEGAGMALERASSDTGTNLFPSAQSDGPTPAVWVSTTPAALIITDGEPQYAPLNGTPLLHISNTTSTVFREPTDQELYVRIPSGWFRAWTTNGPWQQVLTDQLPDDLRTKN